MELLHNYSKQHCSKKVNGEIVPGAEPAVESGPRSPVQQQLPHAVRQVQPRNPALAGNVHIPRKDPARRGSHVVVHLMHRCSRQGYQAAC